MSEGVYDVAIIDGAGEAKALSRDYVLKRDEADDGKAPILTVYGGEIATYWRLAERVMSMLAPTFPDVSGTWTASGALPVDGLERVVRELKAACPACDDPRAHRLVRAYNSRAEKIFAGLKTQGDWGRDFGADLTEHEVRYLMDHEWAVTAEGVLWRRSLLGLFMTRAEAEALGECIRAQPRAATAPAA